MDKTKIRLYLLISWSKYKTLIVMSHHNCWSKSNFINLNLRYNFDRCQKCGYLRQLTLHPKKTIIAHAELQIWILFTLIRIFKVGKKEKLNITTKAHLIKQENYARLIFKQ